MKYIQCIQQYSIVLVYTAQGNSWYLMTVVSTTVNVSTNASTSLFIVT